MHYEYRRDAVGLTVVFRVDDNGSETFIPENPTHHDRIAYEEWLALGNVTTPLPPLPTESEVHISQRNDAKFLLNEHDGLYKLYRAVVELTVQELNIVRNSGWGGISVTNGVAALGGIGASYLKLVPFTASASTGAGVTAQLGGNQRLLFGKTGSVNVHYSLSVTGTASVNYLFALHKNNVLVAESVSKTRLGTSDVQHVAASWVIAVVDTDFVDVRVKAETGTGRSITIQEGRLMANYVSLPDRTLAQARNAINSILDSGAVDV